MVALQGELAQPRADFAPSSGRGNSESGTRRHGEFDPRGLASIRTWRSQDSDDDQESLDPARSELPSGRDESRASE